MATIDSNLNPISDLPTHRRSAGLWCELGSRNASRLLADSGAQWLCFDVQHGAYDRANLLDALRDWRATGPALWVRTPANDAAWIGYALDCGADGVIVPMIETADDAHRAAAAANYAPNGNRSWGPKQRPSSIETAADQRPGCRVMIETAAALNEVEQIAAVDGVTGIFLGPFDLSLALGTTVDALLAADGDDAPLKRILEAGHEAGIEVSAFGGTSVRSARLFELGFDAVAVNSDTNLLVEGAALAVAAARPPAA